MVGHVAGIEHADACHPLTDELAYLGWVELHLLLLGLTTARAQAPHEVLILYSARVVGQCDSRVCQLRRGGPIGHATAHIRA
jgi:hypothetical protein